MSQLFLSLQLELDKSLVRTIQTSVGLTLARTQPVMLKALKISNYFCVHVLIFIPHNSKIAVYEIEEVHIQRHKVNTGST